MSGGPFTRRRIVLVAAVTVASLLTSGLLAAYGELLGDPPTYEADAFSRSAIGHRALVEALRRTGAQVLVSRHATARRSAGDVVTLLLEPRVLAERDDPFRARLVDIARAANQLLLVLPKRRGPPDAMHPGWISTGWLVPDEMALAPLLALDDDGKNAVSLERPRAGVGPWRGELPAPDLEGPQLLRSNRLQPLLEVDEGILVGELITGELRVVVVADPDLISNMGLGRGRNAAVVEALLARLGVPGRPVVVDETLHGHEIQPSLTRELLRFPLVLATLHAIAVAALLAWAALVRFGRPRRPEPSLRAGTAFLVESAADLMHLAGHAGQALESYWRAARDEVLRRCHVQDAGDSDRALQRLLLARGRAREADDIAGRVRSVSQRSHRIESDALRAAQDIHRFREELTDGTDGRG